MAILYGFTKDQGFAMVDTDARAYIYGYPTSPIERHARRHGARKTMELYQESLADLAGFVVRSKAINKPNVPVEQTEHGGYDRVFASLVAPQTWT